ncbi:hypothetical protein FACS189494_01310 [Spirochaetia bacterium]|nr:hypothetical protein FACS189494_01310 [Spirochaetia bacterium]
MSIINKNIPVVNIVFLGFGLAAGFIAGFKMPALLAEKQQRVISWEETGIMSAAEEEALRSNTAAGSNAADRGYNAVPIAGSVQNGSGFNGPLYAATMPVETREVWLDWMKTNRPDQADFLNKRWELATTFLVSQELKRWEDVRAFLLTPREHFVRAMNKGFEYADTWLPIGWGATITDPDVVAMMTTTLNVQPSDNVLEIGTGSGYQSAILSYLSRNVWTIEIIEPLFRETDALYNTLSKFYPSYNSINRKLGDGYYGWQEHAPFDKIIVTCSIDHIPPPLLQQLRAGGIMVLPLGPPGRQYIMEIRKTIEPDGSITLARRDVYNGLWVHFIPFRNETGTSYSRK